jgi:hypothetical protein
LTAHAQRFEHRQERLDRLGALRVEDDARTQTDNTDDRPAAPGGGTVRISPGAGARHAIGEVEQNRLS